MPCTSASPTALRAHINYLQCACNVPIETDRMSCSATSSATLAVRDCAHIEALPWAGLPNAGRLRENRRN
jgi:hypothetical protein